MHLPATAAAAARQHCSSPPAMPSACLLLTRCCARGRHSSLCCWHCAHTRPTRPPCPAVPRTVPVRSTGPLVFTVPPADEEGYWLISFYEAYLSEFAVVGTRATGNGGGKWLLIPPGYAGNTAGFDASHVIQAPTAQGVVLGRIGEGACSVLPPPSSVAASGAPTMGWATSESGGSSMAGGLAGLPGRLAP